MLPVLKFERGRGNLFRKYLNKTCGSKMLYKQQPLQNFLMCCYSHVCKRQIFIVDFQVHKLIPAWRQTGKTEWKKFLDDSIHPQFSPEHYNLSGINWSRVCPLSLYIWREDNIFRLTWPGDTQTSNHCDIYFQDLLPPCGVHVLLILISF